MLKGWPSRWSWSLAKAVWRGSALALLISAPAFCALPVGLDAIGVNPLIALHNTQGLDIRDVQGRSVSVEKVLKDLAAASRRREAQAAYASRLTRAGLFWETTALLFRM
jgi:hypothetical protein